MLNFNLSKKTSNTDIEFLAYISLSYIDLYVKSIYCSHFKATFHKNISLKKLTLPSNK